MLVKLVPDIYISRNVDVINKGNAVNFSVWFTLTSTAAAVCHARTGRVVCLAVVLSYHDTITLLISYHDTIIASYIIPLHHHTAVIP